MFAQKGKTGKPNLEKLKALVQGFLGLNLSIGLTGFLTVHISWVTGLATSLVISLILLAQGFRAKQKILIWSSVTTLAASILINIYLVNISTYFPVKDLEEILNYPNSHSFALNNAKPRFDLTGVFIANDKKTYQTAPLVSQNWEKSQKIKAWVVCLDPEKLETIWQGSTIKGSPIKKTRQKEYAKAIQDSLLKHGLTTYDHPVIIQKDTPKTKASFNYNRKIWPFAALFNLLWLMGIIGSIFYPRTRS